ncbi:PPM1K, partial [Cordylochernes scorpioides]
MRYILTSSLVVRIVRNSSARRFCSRPKKEVPQQIDFDTLGIWDNRIDWPLLLQQSIKHGKPIPQISIKNAGYASVSGRRPTNEDRYRCRELAQDLLYLAVFDGHGGPQCADFASQHLESHILSKLHRGQMDLRAILRISFLELNTAFQEYVQRESDFQAAKSGTTATVVLLRNSMELVVGHVGDSRVLLCRDGEVRKLTTDHTDDVEEEEERVLQAGGTIKHDDTTGRGLVNGRLAMTRSLGDLELKPYGVVADPETKSLE